MIRRHGGHANKFIGDGLPAVFGAPERHPDHAARAVAAAREIAELVRRGSGGRLRVGLGVNSGDVVVEERPATPLKGKATTVRLYAPRAET